MKAGRTAPSCFIAQERCHLVAQLERPESPSSVHETGLDPGFLADLTLKSLYFGGNISGSDLVERLHLPLIVVAETLAFLRKQRLVEVTGGSGMLGAAR